MVCVCCLLAVLAGGVQAQTIPLWGRWERLFYAGTGSTPEAALAVEFTSPSGKIHTITGFWDGGTTWGARFMPVEAGLWRYRTRSEPALPGLDGQSGEFLCKRSEGSNRFAEHGPLRISPNGRFFQHADGTPFFWLGDTVWYGAILSSRADWGTYLSDRARKGFDVVHFNVVAPRNGVAADENGEISFADADRVRPVSRSARILRETFKYFGLGEDKPLRMNPRFYQRLDERINAVNSSGLLAALVLTWGMRPEDSGNALAEADVVRLIRYLEARYGAHHVVWILTGDNTYEGASGERWKRIGRAAFGGRPHAPVTTHPWGMIWPWQGFRDEEWLDFIIYQSGHGDDANAMHWIHSGPPSQHWLDRPFRPVINLEPPYEGALGYQSRKPHSDYSTRRAIYWSLLNVPTAGVTYGAHGVWSWHTAVGQPPTDHPKTGVAKTWREALSFPGSTQMEYVAQLFESIAWWKLEPDANLLANQPGADDPARYVSASRSDTGDLAVIYLPAGGRITLRDGVLRVGLRAEWFSPRTGQRTRGKNSAVVEFVAPDEQDWVLLLKGK
jgi:Protein of unknown function (DUF4038)/Domain of unknown function (DUF5060)/Putative collagen-binding domain of a collagenase